MAALGHVFYGADSVSHSTCLHFEGFPAILWDTLRWFGYQSPPLYVGRMYQEHGVQRCNVQAVVPPPPCAARVAPARNLDLRAHSGGYMGISCFADPHPVLSTAPV